MKTALSFIMNRLQEEFPEQMRDIYESNQFLAESILIESGKLFKQEIQDAYSSGYEQTLKYFSTNDSFEFPDAERYYNKTFNK